MIGGHRAQYGGKVWWQGLVARFGGKVWWQGSLRFYQSIFKWYLITKIILWFGADFRDDI